MDFKAKFMELLKKGWPFLAVLAIGVGIGWGVKPAQVRVEEKTKIVEVEKQVVVVQEKVTVQVVRVKDTQVVERWHREKTEEKKPDGSVVTKEVEDKNVDSVVKENTNTTQVKIVEVEKQVVVTRDVIVEKKIEPILHNWSVGVLVGTSPRFDSPTDTPLLLAVAVDRRILGPIFLSGQLQGGSPVVGGFKITNPSLFLGVKGEF